MTDTIETLRAELARQTAIAVDHCERADVAERARDEVGIQLAAAQERLRLAMAVVDAFDRYRCNATDENMVFLGRARRALDAVPGDALAPVVRGAPFDEAGTVNPDRITAALEASGIDTDNVKGVE